MFVASTSRGETSLRSLAVPFLLLYLIVVYPLWAIPAPPLIDYPNHLARIFILANPQHPVLAQFYESHWGVLPNLAMELFATPLAMLLSVEVAGKLFISMIFLLVASGVLAAHYALHRRLSAWPWLSFFFLYNPFLLWGWAQLLVRSWSRVVVVRRLARAPRTTLALAGWTGRNAASLLLSPA